MTLAWGGALLVTSDVRPEWLNDFRAWHNLEHLPERMAVPGFIAARRFVDTAIANRFLTLYQVRRPETFESARYRALLESPSEATVRILGEAVTGAVRLICRRAGGFARGEGGSISLDIDPLTTSAGQIEALQTHEGVAAAHLLVTDTRLTRVPSTAISDMELSQDVPVAVRLIENWSSDSVWPMLSRGVVDRHAAIYRLEASFNAL